MKAGDQVTIKMPGHPLNGIHAVVHKVMEDDESTVITVKLIEPVGQMYAVGDWVDVMAYELSRGEG